MEKKREFSTRKADFSTRKAGTEHGNIYTFEILCCSQVHFGIQNVMFPTPADFNLLRIILLHDTRKYFLTYKDAK